MFVVVPPQIYYEYFNKYDGYWDFYKTVFEFQPYPGGSFSWHHLWFILYLFLYSILLIPFLVYIRSERSIKFRERISRWLSSPAGMLLLPSLFIFATQLLLRPYFPDEEHNLTDWAYFVFYMCFFFFGMLCYSENKLWHSIGTNRKQLLAASLFALVPFYVCYFHFRDLIVLPWTDDTVELIFDITAIFLSWFTVITVIGYGQHYLNKPHPWLTKLSEGLYPFYILHQTVIIVIGYYICQFEWSIAAKFWSIAILTLIFCWGFYMVLIRPFNIMRFLFGMKPKQK
jgi:hypothetical protein